MGQGAWTAHCTSLLVNKIAWGMGQGAWCTLCISLYLHRVGSMGYGVFQLFAPCSMPLTLCFYKINFLKFVIFLLNSSKSFNI